VTSPLGELPVTFIGSFPDPDVQLDPPLPEIAFVGRSNVGKSSLLNALTGKAGLARVSATPGKTTLVNVFRLPAFYLVDLPGYGYARASHGERQRYRELLGRYLERRERLAGVVWLLDLRHPPSRDDLAMQELLVSANRATLAVFTKADKFSHAQRHTRERELAAALGLQQDQVQVVSSRSGLGVAELGQSILSAGGRA
jgi:GTP-binding protein